MLSREEISHILGLKDNRFDMAFENEGWNIEYAQPSIVKRYKNLTNNQDKVPFDRILSLSEPNFLNEMLNLSRTQGSYHGFATRWKGHAFTLHAIKDKDGVHFIYVNRGERHLGPDSHATVSVFTPPKQDAESLKKFSSEIYKAFASENQQTVSKFINNASPKPSKLQKSNQKVGNCTIANSNIAWHFQLASRYLQDNPNASYEQALIETKLQYRELRKRDRVEAFKALSALNPNAEYPKDAHMNDILQALDKLNRKMENPSYIQLLLEDDKTCKKLIGMLTEPDFKHHMDNYIGGIKGFNNQEGIRKKMDKMRDSILSASFSILTPEEQKKKIQRDQSLQAYSIHTHPGHASIEELKKLVQEFKSHDKPYLLLRDTQGSIYIDKKGITLKANNGSTTLLQESDLNGILARIPKHAITSKLSNPINPKSTQNFNGTNPETIGMLLTNIPETYKKGIGWRELAYDKQGKIGIECLPPHYKACIITKDYRIEVKGDKFEVFNIYHQGDVKNTKDAEKIIRETFARIPQDKVQLFLNKITPPTLPQQIKSSSIPLDNNKVGQVTRLIKHYATGVWEDYSNDKDTVEFGISHTTPGMIFNNYKLMVSDKGELIFLDNKGVQINDENQNKILDELLTSKMIQLLQPDVPSEQDKANTEQLSRLIMYQATDYWPPEEKRHAQTIEFGFGTKSNLPSMVYEGQYQLMVTNDPKNPLIVLDKMQNFRTITNPELSKLLEKIAKDPEVNSLMQNNEFRQWQIISLINHRTAGLTPGNWDKVNKEPLIDVGIGGGTKQRTLVFGDSRLLIPNPDPNKPPPLNPPPLELQQKIGSEWVAVQGEELSKRLPLLLGQILDNEKIKQLQSTVPKNISVPTPKVNHINMIFKEQEKQFALKFHSKEGMDAFLNRIGGEKDINGKKYPLCNPHTFTIAFDAQFEKNQEGKFEPAIVCHDKNVCNLLQDALDLRSDDARVDATNPNLLYIQNKKIGEIFTRTIAIPKPTENNINIAVKGNKFSLQFNNHLDMGEFLLTIKDPNKAPPPPQIDPDTHAISFGVDEKDGIICSSQEQKNKLAQALALDFSSPAFKNITNGSIVGKKMPIPTGPSEEDQQIEKKNNQLKTTTKDLINHLLKPGLANSTIEFVARIDNQAFNELKPERHKYQALKSIQFNFKEGDPTLHDFKAKIEKLPNYKANELYSGPGRNNNYIIQISPDYIPILKNELEKKAAAENKMILNTAKNISSLVDLGTINVVGRIDNKAWKEVKPEYHQYQALKLIQLEFDPKSPENRDKFIEKINSLPSRDKLIVPYVGFSKGDKDQPSKPIIQISVESMPLLLKELQEQKINEHKQQVKERIKGTLEAAGVEEKYKKLSYEFKMINDQFATKYGKDSEISNKMSAAHAALDQNMKKIFADPIAHYDTCKKECDASVEAALNESRKHRGWHKIDPILRGVVGVLATISIIPALIVKFKSQHGYLKTFYADADKLETKTSEQLLNFKNRYDALKTDIGSKIQKENIETNTEQAKQENSPKF